MTSLHQNQIPSQLRALASASAIALIYLVAPVLHAAEQATVNNEERFFLDKIEPILKNHCFECHSHAAGQLEGGLTLDSRSGWVQGGDRGTAIHPGKAEESLIVKAVRHSDPDLQMPPDQKLADAQIQLLTEWVQRGAADPRKAIQPPADDTDPLDWWSLRNLQQPPIPEIANATGSNPIDAFIGQRLKTAGLQAAPPADRRTLIRRLYFNLHGLPPGPAVVKAFETDSDPAAYEKLVDQLLSSERYGERWARHWLDTVHFADSHGCEHDVFRPNAWPYRDYVISSFNRDTPWARFIREQLAADRLFPEETQLTAALGFISAGPLELSRAGTAPITFDYLDRDDMVAQTMAAFASTTANCARCHNHKFDPITQQDYYSLQAVFAGVGKGDIEYDADPKVAGKRKHWMKLLLAATNKDHPKLLAPEYAKLVAKWEQQLEEHPAVWEPLSPATFHSSGGAILKRLDDNSILASDVRPDQDTYTITAPTSLTRLTAVRLDVLADDSLPMHGPGRQDNGNLHLTEFEAVVFSPNAPQPTQLKFHRATADFEQTDWTIAHTLDGDLKTAWGIYPKVGVPHHAVFELHEPLTLQPGTQILVALKQLHGGGHLIGRLKLYATDAENASAEVLPESVLSALQVSSDARSAEQQTAIAAHVLRQHAEQQLAALPAKATVYAVSSSYSRASKLPEPLAPKVVNVLRRGDIHKPGNVALPGALSAITTLPGRFELQDAGDEATRRVALAEWLAAPENPLTWRSVVNRVWSYHFGNGLCDTPGDFGRMGGTPSHPELLDWLAVWFRDDANGSLKKLHRLILLSSAYQQASRIPDIAEAVNPESIDGGNRLLWRMNRARLDAESFRDAVLQISGRITLDTGGPGVQQFTQSQGAQATPKLDYDAFHWDDPSATRRSIYRVVWRGIADPFMESLDFPDLGLLVPKRGVSVSALQALTVFNNDFVLHHSQVLADQLTDQHPDIEQQVAEACRLIFLREPRQQEASLLAQYASQYGLAAMCRVLLNSNEFIFVD